MCIIHFFFWCVQCMYSRPYVILTFPPSFSVHTRMNKHRRRSGVARAFPGGRLAHPEGQNEEENK